MKYAKTLGLLAVVGAALMAFAGIASATTLTNQSGGVLPVGTVIKAEGEAPHTQLDGTINITCAKSEVEGSVTNAGSATTTVKGNVTKLTFTECGNHTVTVVKGGTLEVHTKSASADGDGTLTSSGAEVTVLTHSLFLGTRHCIYVTSNTHVGTVTGSKNTKGHATIDIGSAPIPQAATDSLCGNDALWTGNYTVKTPAYLDVD